MQPVTVLPDVFVDAYFLRAYMQCHFAANHLPTLVPLRPEIRLNEQGEYIAIDTTEATLNYRMMHCCRVLENTLRRYALEFEGLRSDLDT